MFSAPAPRRPRRRCIFLVPARAAARPAWGAVLAVLAVLPAAASRAQTGPPITITPVVQIGDAAPGGGVYSWVYNGAPGINNQGRITFTAGRYFNNVTFGGIYAATLAPGAQTGTGGQIMMEDKNAAPAPVTGVFKGWNLFPSISDNGAVVSNAGVENGNTTYGIFSAGPATGASAMMLALGQPSPFGESGTQTGSGTTPGISANGIVCVQGFNSAFPFDGIYTRPASGGAASVIVKDGDPAPGGGTFTNGLDQAISINSDGRAIFWRDVTGGAGPGIFTGKAGTVPLAVARVGETTPLGGAYRYSDFGNFDEGDATGAGGYGDGPSDIADNGTVVYTAKLSGGVITEAVFLRPAGAGSAVTVASAGQAAPGGGAFASFGPPAVNASGMVLFTAKLTGATSTPAVFCRTASGVLRRIVGKGDPSPRAGQSAIANVYTYSHSLNDRGQMAFWYEVPNVPAGVINGAAVAQIQPFNLRAKNIACGPDDKVRLLWEKWDNSVTLWTVGLTGVIENGKAFAAPMGYKVKTLTVDANNKTRLLWEDANGRIAVWTLSANLQIIESGTYFGPNAPGNPQRLKDVAVGSDNRLRLLWTTDAEAQSPLLWTVAPTGISVEAYWNWPGAAATYPHSVATGPNNRTWTAWRYLNPAVGAGVSLSLLATTGDAMGAMQTVFLDPAATNFLDLAVGSDNKPRELFASPTGQATIRRLAATGAAVEATNAFGPYAGLVPVKITAGKTDNKLRLLWFGDDGRAVLWTLNAAGTAAERGSTYGPY